MLPNINKEGLLVTDFLFKYLTKKELKKSESKLSQLVNVQIGIWVKEMIRGYFQMKL